jgi:hypothetical protein
MQAELSSIDPYVYLMLVLKFFKKFELIVQGLLRTK